MAHKLSQARGLAPGTPIYIGEPPQAECGYSYVRFDQETVEVSEFTTAAEVKDYYQIGKTNWVTVQGIHKTQEIAEICQFFDLHPLIVEDIVNSEQRPKIEFYDDCIFCVIRLFHIDNKDHIEPENISLVLGRNYVLVFIERKIDYFGPVRSRLWLADNRIQTLGGSYLSFAILDVLVDQYYETVEWLDAKIIELDDELFEHPDEQTLREIHTLKKDVFEIARYTKPVLEIATRFMSQESPLIHRKTHPFFRDLLDHAIQVVDSMDSHKEMLYNLQAQYLALSSKKMNEVMQFLTIMGSLFIPLTFISSVYGMNFKFMPELGLKYGYFGALGFMSLVAFLLLAYFKKKRWF